jgi:hypothetical protein
MNYFFPGHKELLINLLQNKVDFIIVGGYAVIFHGYVRTTDDLDIWIKPDNSNKVKLIEVLKLLHFSDSSIEKIKELDFSTMVAFHFGGAPERVDFLTKLTGIDFDSSISNVEFLNFESWKIPFLSLHDLVITKMLTTRLKDHSDVEELQKIHTFNKKKRE